MNKLKVYIDIDSQDNLHFVYNVSEFLSSKSIDWITKVNDVTPML